MGTPQHSVKLIASLYEKSESIVRVNDVEAASFEPQRGVRQKFILLFNTYVEYMDAFRLEGTKQPPIRRHNVICLLGTWNGGTFYQSAASKRMVGLSINKVQTKVMLVDRVGLLTRSGELPDFEFVGKFYI
ncbi:unnamed protein product [Pieris macdunnoughi]|uniref:Uncharacterized protein n=1 Tax=Pieris macdunnoughi TaxID=345717 RepID=A0A821PCB4_9NEOP|nr:unnamed protein product [Pieris macdunnoughi]